MVRREKNRGLSDWVLLGAAGAQVGIGGAF